MNAKVVSDPRPGLPEPVRAACPVHVTHDQSSIGERIDSSGPGCDRDLTRN